MKKIVPFFVCMLLCIFCYAQGGVNFEHLTFDEALAKAKTEKKLVFMDCFTTWCGPCKYMTNTVFPQEKAGEFFNSRFVCVKYDMEQGEGKELRKKLGVRAFPTFFIIRPDGTVQHTVVGGGDLEEFIARVEKGLNEKTSLLYLNGVYEKGKMSKKQMVAYYEALSDAYDQEKSEKIYNELCAQLSDKDKLKAEFWPIVSDDRCKVGSADFNLILSNIPVLEKNIGKEKLQDYLFSAYNGVLSQYILGRAKDVPTLPELKRQIDGLKIAKQEELLSLYGLAEIVDDKDIQTLLGIMEEKAGNCSISELTIVFAAFRTLEGVATKADFARVAALREKVMKNPVTEERKDYWELVLDTYQKKAYTGVYFEDLTFEQALEKARKQNKLIFLDGYTSWCGPCKYMSNTIFPQEKAGDYLNRFICVKYDMEKGEGPELAKKFGVRAYPTFVIINPEGTVRHKLVGGGEADEFIERVKEAFDEEKATGLLDARYQKGDRDKVFLNNYVQSLVSQYSPEAGKVAEELFRSLNDEEKVSKDYWFLFSNKNIATEDSEMFKYLLANREKFNAVWGKAAMDQRIGSTYQNRLGRIIAGRDTSATVQSLDQLKKEIIGMKFTQEKSLLANANIAKAVLSENPARILSVCEQEAGNLTVMDFPLRLVFSITPTPAQKSRWVKLYKKLAASCEEDRMRQVMDSYVEQLEK